MSGVVCGLRSMAGLEWVIVSSVLLMVWWLMVWWLMVRVDEHGCAEKLVGYGWLRVKRRSEQSRWSFEIEQELIQVKEWLCAMCDHQEIATIM